MYMRNMHLDLHVFIHTGIWKNTVHTYIHYIGTYICKRIHANVHRMETYIYSKTTYFQYIHESKHAYIYIYIYMNE